MDAISWIAENDDTEFLHDEHGTISVTLALVADIFGRTEDEAIEDLKRAIKRVRS